MAKQYVLTLTADEQVSLTELVQQRRVASARLVRAQCLLAAATNDLSWSDAQTSPAMVGRGLKKCPPALKTADVGDSEVVQLRWTV